MNSLLRRRLTVLGALVITPIAGFTALAVPRSNPAAAAPVTVMTGAGSSATDPTWSITPPSSTATPATAITTAPAGWTASITGARWIGTTATPTTDPAGSYEYTASVSVPSGASLAGSLASLDQVTVALVQGPTTTTVPGTFGGSASAPTPLTFAGPLTGGTYTARLTVNHASGTTPVGLIAALTFSDAVTTEPPATAYHALAVPVRVYDSRTGTGPAATGDGVLASGTTRTVALATGYASQGATTRVSAVPAGATSAMINLTIDGTVNTGFLTVYANGTTQPATSSINWFGSNQILANLNVVAVASDGTIKVTAGGGGSAHVIVDVLGYYRAATT